MKAELCVMRKGKILYQQRHDIFDAESFGQACQQAWDSIEEERIKTATSIGALFDDLESDAAALDDVTISLHRVIS